MTRDDDPIHVSWIHEDGTISLPVEHTVSCYGGLVPLLGDVIVMSMKLDGEPVDHCVDKVIERYCVTDLHDGTSWYLVAAEANLAADRLAMSTAPRPDLEGQLEALSRATLNRGPSPPRRLHMHSGIDSYLAKVT
jgi:hypothetical protein